MNTFEHLHSCLGLSCRRLFESDCRLSNPWPMPLCVGVGVCKPVDVAVAAVYFYKTPTHTYTPAWRLE